MLIMDKRPPETSTKNYHKLNRNAEDTRFKKKKAISVQAAQGPRHRVQPVLVS